ncbi:DUF1120 domain-containing protein [Aeromonas sanarellii]|uniref:DUF1120 domain-containing protein n=1 Tax=Aeromonas sanarellii TaxID=633415 RepID=UPI0039A2814C
MKKKKLTFSVAGFFIALHSFSAGANESFDITVSGTITPGACLARLTGGGNFDYGNILSSSLSQDAHVILPVKSSSFSITCDAPSKIALKSIDNRQGTNSNPVGQDLVGRPNIPANASLFGLGLDSSNNKIGSFNLRIDDASISADDGIAVDTIYSADNGATWAKGGGQTGFNSVLSTWAKRGEVTPYAFKTLTGQIDLQAAIAPSSQLNLSQPVNLDGSVTVQLYYL